MEEPDRPAATSRLQGEHRISMVLTHPRIPRRWTAVLDRDRLAATADMDG